MYTSLVEDNEALNKQVGKLEAENARLRKALEWYADKSAWRGEVLNSYTGEVSIFDWPGDLGDEPWEIAANALESKS